MSEVSDPKPLHDGMIEGTSYRMSVLDFLFVLDRHSVQEVSLMTVRQRRTIITSIQRLMGNEPDLPDDLPKGVAYAIDAVVEGKAERFFYIKDDLGGTFRGYTKIFGPSIGVQRILSPFVQSYMRGEHYVSRGPGTGIEHRLGPTSSAPDLCSPRTIQPVRRW